jgi:hypothetical protein
MLLPFAPVPEKWQGQYFYGHPYSDKVRSQAVAFSLAWFLDDGALLGTCTDAATAGLFACPVPIRGFIHDDFISFVKQYPCQCTVDAQGQHRLHPELRGDEIHYTGTYADGQWAGEWQIRTDLRATPHLVEQAVCAGTWVLHRES